MVSGLWFLVYGCPLFETPAIVQDTPNVATPLFLKPYTLYFLFFRLFSLI
jgi:hypothetical protein